MHVILNFINKSKGKSILYMYVLDCSLSKESSDLALKLKADTVRQKQRAWMKKIKKNQQNKMK